MNEVKAFVGHSFTPDDAAVVGSFLKYFDQVKGLYPTFSWEHAEAAEPRELADKVLSLIAGKNVFIAICTRKERVLSDCSLKSLLFQPLYSKAKKTDLTWKTSDWVIQEIGLAIGRGLDLILLVEEGLRPPGGLQGNVEYITFNRDAPEKSFGKILEMIRALAPKVAQAGAATSDVPPKEQETEPPLSEQEPDWASPKPDWSFDDYKRAMFRSIVLDSPENAAKIDAAYLASDDAKVGTHKVEWGANAEYIRIYFGKGGDLEKLKTIAADNSGNRDILFYLAMALAEYDEHGEAARIFEAAAQVANDEADKQNLLGFAAINRAEAGDMVSTLAMTDELRRAASADPKIERDILGTLRRIAEIQKDQNVVIAVMERIVEIEPGDFDIRFSLAYKHSELGNDDLALHHYLKIPHHQRNSMAWNNLGVSFDHFSMPAKSVRCYRKSEDQGETLSMSNLGYKLMGAGFLKEAQEKFDKALTIKDYHRNVGQGLARLKDIPEEEDKKEQEVLEGAKKKAEFYRLLGKAVSQPPLDLGGRWQGPNCEFAVTVSGRKMRAVGSYERDSNALFSALLPGSKLMTKYQVEYEGTVTGRQIEGEVRRVRDGGGSASTSILGLNDTKSKVLIVVGDSGVFKVMENPHSTSPTFYELKAI